MFTHYIEWSGDAAKGQCCLLFENIDAAAGFARDCFWPVTIYPIPRRRTVTAKAATGPAACKYCGKSEPREQVWGIAAGGFTTAELSKVAYWVCDVCFGHPPRYQPGPDRFAYPPPEKAND